MSEVLEKLTEDFAKLSKDFPKLTEVLRNLTERIFQMTEGPKYLTEHPPVNVRTPTKIGNKMSEPRRIVVRMVFYHSKVDHFPFFLRQNQLKTKNPKSNLLKTFFTSWSCLVHPKEFPSHPKSTLLT
ncbi:hypothetical protein [Sutcliffiella horikoshii]|uniref:hypothetical protein n=1 Tax=Sutcliffiella horikoshii TaxID=79883 RepID=UPI001653BB91|nr:hypothetical protein [Sutcliffiella horikoshii]